MDEANLNCESASFENLQTSIKDKKYVQMEYKNLYLKEGSIEINCSEWINPIEPGMFEGYSISILTKYEAIIDRSVAFSHDGSLLKPALIPENSLEITVSNPYADELSNYTINMTPPIPVNKSTGCFTKIILPAQIGLDDLVTNENIISATSGQIFIRGCETSLTLQNLKNPNVIDRDLIIGIIVSKDIDGNLLILENLEVVIPQSLFEHSQGQITEASITTGGNILGETTTIQFDFIPVSEMPASKGFIQIEVPLWVTVLEGKIYPFDQQFSCQYASGEILDTTVEENRITIDYNIIVKTEGRILIECQGWKNPIRPLISQGFLFRTFTKNMVLIDNSINFSLDAS